MLDIFENFTEEDLGAIYSRVPRIVKGANIPETAYDFNRMFESFNHSDIEVGKLINCPPPDAQGKQKIDLATVYQIRVKYNDVLNFVLEEVHQKFYGGNRKPDVCFFYTAGIGVSRRHTDVEDVHLIGSHGSTTYRVFIDGDKWHDFELEVGDYLYIPSGTPHWAISKGPRISISLGVM